MRTGHSGTYLLQESEPRHQPGEKKACFVSLSLSELWPWVYYGRLRSTVKSGVGADPLQKRTKETLHCLPGHHENECRQSWVVPQT